MKKVSSQVKTHINSQPAKKSLLKGSGLQNALAAIMILLIIISVGVRLWAIQITNGIKPPDNVSSNGENICIHMNKKLYFLTNEGRLERHVDLLGVEITREPADVQLLKNGDILIGDLDKGTIMRCNDSGLSCRQIAPAGGYSINDKFKFLADEERNFLFIADTNNHRVLVQDMEGTYSKEFESKSSIKYPNDMTLDRDGLLWLSNTFHKELLSFKVDGDRIVESENSIKLRPRIIKEDETEETMKKDPPEPEGWKDLLEMIKKIKQEQEKLGKDLVHIRPLALALDAEDNLWVVASDRFITTAGVRVFNPEGTQIKRIPLGEEAIPVDVTRAGEKILIADSGLFQIFSVNTDTGAVEVFGDEGFQSEVVQIGNELRKYQGIKKWAGRSIWLMGLGTIILVLIIIIQNYNARNRAARTDQADTISKARVTGRSFTAAEEIQSETTMKRYRIEFTGSGSEYFRIWIVNTFLTILTLGIYAAWAKVRHRKYFYKNIILNGRSFDYTANPLAIFKGYVIVGSGLLLYYLSQAFNPVFSLIIIGLFSLIIPFLIYKSLRFFTRNSVYRNIRFRFLGTLGSSYGAYLLIPLLIPFTIGLIIPYWVFLKKKYFFHNLAFGTTNNSFKGKPGQFYQVYLTMGCVLFGLIFASIILMSIFFAMFSIGAAPDKADLGIGIMFIMVFTYTMIIFVSTFAQQYIYAWVTNYCLKHSELGEIRFESTLNGFRLFWIRISNIFAIVFSFGLLIPWAKVRRMRYIVDNISLITRHDLNDFTAAAETDESAYGDAATDFFDFEISL